MPGAAIRHLNSLQENLVPAQLLLFTPPAMNMNIIARACVLALVLLLALCSQTFAGPVGGDPPTSCCFQYTSRKIPLNLLKDYYETSSRCSQPAVVFITKKGRQICADPTEKWVQDHMTHLELN